LSSETASVVPTARIARLSVALLLTINMFNYVDRFVLAATLTPIKKELFSPNDKSADFWMGMLFTAFLVSYMCAAPVFGWLADRRSRWKLIGVAVVVWSLASGASGLAHVFGTWGIVSTFTALLISRLFVGIGEAAYGPAAPTVISDLFPIQRRGSVLAWFYMAIPVGSAVGYVWGGTISKLLDWHWAFYLVVPPGMLLGLLCFLMPEPVRGAAETTTEVVPIPRTSRRAKLDVYWTLLRTPSYVWNTAGMTAMTFAIGGVAAWMPTYVHEFRKEPDLGHVNTIFGAITVVSGISATLLGGLVADRLSARFPGAYFLVSGTAMLLGFPCFLLVLVTPFPWAWVLIFLAEFCLFFNTGPTNTIVANVTHPAIRSSAYALNIFVIHSLGDAISPPLIGKLRGLFDGNMNVGFLAVSLTILLGGIFWLAGARFLERDTKLAPTLIAP
jgi:MFS transporter, Spinster family, sphingosine-1-phosphate transporter